MAQHTVWFLQGSSEVLITLFIVAMELLVVFIKVYSFTEDAPNDLIRRFLMGFEVFEKATAPVTTVPSVTIQKRGMISLNSAAHQMMGEPKALMFLWDAQRRVIGLKACDLSDPNAYPIRSTGPARSNESEQKQTRAKRGKAVLVAGTMFTKYIGLDTSEARRWVPYMEKDVLIVDLNSESQRAVSNRTRAKEAAASEGAAT